MKTLMRPASAAAMVLGIVVLSGCTMNDSLIAVIGRHGSLTLPGLARGRGFAGDLHTVAALLEAARAPDTTSVLDLP